jgi:hypothetical protein
LIQTDWGWLALVGSAVLLPAGSGRRRAAGGLGLLALALGALRAGGSATAVPGDFAAIELALVLVGLAIVAGPVLRSARRGWLGAGPAALLVGGVALLLPSVRPLARLAPAAGILAAAGVVAGIAILAWAGAGLLLRRVPPRLESDPRAGATRIACAAAGVLLAAFGPHILVIFPGVLLAAGALGGEGLRLRRVSSWVPLAIAAVTLVPAGWLLATIAGEQGLATRALSGLPLSPAAETLLAALLMLAAWSVAGLWPLPRSPLAGVAGLAGVFLLGRLAVPALPEGLDHWRPLASPLLGLGLWQAIGSRRWAAGLVAGALFAVAAGSHGGVTAAWWLGGAGLGAGIAELFTPRGRAWLACLAALAAAVGLLPATAAGLRVEVVYTALTVAGAAALLAADRGRTSAR